MLAFFRLLCLVENPLTHLLKPVILDGQLCFIEPKRVHGAQENDEGFQTGNLDKK